MLSPGLAALAAELGIEATYVGWDGREVTAPEGAVVDVLRALGVPIDRVGVANAGKLAAAHDRDRWERPIEPVLVAWLDDSVGVLEVDVRTRADVDGELRLALREERGDVREVVVRLFDLPADGHAWPGDVVHCLRRVRLEVTSAGYHTLSWSIGDRAGEARVIAAPRRAPTATSRRWGLFAPTYALRSAASGGAGDLASLRRVMQPTRDAGGAFVGTLPLLAAFLDEPCEPSPYAPASRLAWNELYLDLVRAAARVGDAAVAARLDAKEIVAECARLHALPLIDYRAQHAWRRPLLDALAETAWSSPARRAELEAFARRPHQLRYAAFRAVGDARRQAWHAWAPAMHDALRAIDERTSVSGLPGDLAHDAPARVRAHLFAQWAMDEQLGELRRDTGCGLYVDLPVGVGSDAYDVFAHPALFVRDAATGAPPDALFLGGQDWGLPPLHPARIRDTGWAYVIDVVRHHVRHAAMLRIDHVMGLHRLYWVPRGRPATDGVYVRYAADELWAILCLEASRAGCELVGEDLGVVPPAVPRAMTEHGVRSLSVRQFTLPASIGATPAVPPVACVASLGTHDTPTFAAHWRGDDIGVLVELGLATGEQAEVARAARAGSRDATCAELVAQGLLGAEATHDEAQVLRALHRQLAASPAQDVLVTAEDLWLEPLPQNVPGTGPERPNWRRPHARTLDAWLDDPAIGAQLEEIEGARRT